MAAGRLGRVRLFGKLAHTVPTDKHVAFLTDLWTHNASYIGGLIGGISLMVWVWRWRNRTAIASECVSIPAGPDTLAAAFPVPSELQG